MPDTTPGERPPIFDAAFRQQFEALLVWRRDVRRFRPDTVPVDLLARLTDLVGLSPSVGNSQPWRLVTVENPVRRAKIIAEFKRCNAEALATYDPDLGSSYARLKLEGLEVAPVHLAIFCDETTQEGHGLGRLTMPETLSYSAVIAVHTLWLVARAHGLGVGWVSILDPQSVRVILDVPTTWHLIAYLCIGWPVEEHIDPELDRHGWQSRSETSRTIVRR